MTTTFKNISDMEQTVDGVGIVLPGETCEISDETFNNPNFEKSSGTADKKKTPKNYKESELANDDN